jgi:ADP-ribosylglycohydrolase
MNDNILENSYSVGCFCVMPHPMMPLTGFGAWVVTSRYEILNNMVVIDEIGNGKAWIENYQLDRTLCRNGFYDRYISERKYSRTFMLGAICGDVAGSVYEHHNIKFIPDKDRLIQHNARFTDDSVMTVAVAEGIMNGMKVLEKYKDFTPDDEPVIMEEIRKSVYSFGNRYPDAGYGGSFRRWLRSDAPEPYNSWGNGSAMRASYAGLIARSLKDAEFLAAASAKITHDHPEGIKGAVAVAGSIHLLTTKGEKNNELKELVRKYVSNFYDIDFRLDDIRESYHFDVSCQGSVPYAIKAFLEGSSFEEVLALAISIGGDSDTIAAIAGSLAEVIYPISDDLRDRVLKCLDYNLKSHLAGTIDFMMDKFF